MLRVEGRPTPVKSQPRAWSGLFLVLLDIVGVGSPRGRGNKRGKVTCLTICHGICCGTSRVDPDSLLGTRSTETMPCLHKQVTGSSAARLTKHLSVISQSTGIAVVLDRTDFVEEPFRRVRARFSPSLQRPVSQQNSLPLFSSAITFYSRNRLRGWRVEGGNGLL